MEYFVNVGVVMTCAAWGTLYLMVEGIPSFVPEIKVSVDKSTSTATTPPKPAKLISRRLHDPNTIRPTRLSKQASDEL